MQWDEVEAPTPDRLGSAVSERYRAAVCALRPGRALELKNISWQEVRFLRNHCPRGVGRFSVRTRKLPTDGPLTRYDAWVTRVE